jgi:hypothetical protein
MGKLRGIEPFGADGVEQVYSVADVHMDETAYRDPLKWDPARYLPDRAEDKKQQHGYIGWGTGLHPCCKHAHHPSLSKRMTS